MDRSGAGGGAYLLRWNVSIRTGKRKQLLFIGKLEKRTVDSTRRLRAYAPAAGMKAPRLELKAFHGVIVQSTQARKKTWW